MRYPVGMALGPKDTEIGGPSKGFPTTHWTMVLRTRDLSTAESRAALECLINAYWKPVYHFLRRRGNDSETSKDLTQSFFATILERDALQNITEGGGRFRSFLLTVLRNFIADEHDRATALKRGGTATGLSLDFQEGESELPWAPSSNDTPEAVFRRSWALRVLSQAWERVRDHYASGGRIDEYQLFRDHLSFEAEPQIPYAEMASRLGLSETDIKNRIHAARGRLADAIRDVVRTYTDGEEEVREELRDLLSAFS